ncbi:aKG-HExxH-type peptide beta-hydroxylase [Candidatus Methylomicrobium oryzae]|jgi:hypothetical protein|uniref:aKG-HExxH-type peptide beta-hydroxylase n=1 Tax=Candidatus Methylomicrobium oryzae TaxID=2802053 RepID=UPI0019204712|nr:HEXXH motif-containing putative peptide modification protein [Methylomicrobium sp. RS1]MBL1264247.1 hypothetical protein [Methylomicrobium sp. RS1]
MRSELANSIDYLGQALDDQLGEKPPGLAELGERLKRGDLYPPSTFGLYYEISSALMYGDHASAADLFRELSLERPITPELKIVTLDQIVPPSKLARYQRLMDTDSETPFHIMPPQPDEAGKPVERFRAAFERLQKAVPALAEEFEAIIREVILVVGDKSNGYDFAGGSCYLLWGALFINAEQHATDVAMIEAMAHESAHSLLFGFTIEEPLVENQGDERYTSPLRDDPRPMDGIYHATFVSARMHWAMSRLLESNRLSSEEISLVVASREADRRSFWNGFETVRQYGKLSETGNKLMASAYDYMSPFQRA